MWFFIAIVAVFPIYWGTRYWFAFRRVWALEKAIHRLGEAVGQTRAEVEKIIGIPNRVSEPTPGEEQAIWSAEGRFSLLDAYRVGKQIEYRLRFQNGVCVPWNPGSKLAELQLRFRNGALERCHARQKK